MKNQYYKESRKKHTIIENLLREKRNGKHETFRKLSLSEVKLIEKTFPLIYPMQLIIHTKEIPNYKYVNNSLLKRIHIAYKKRKKYLIVSYKEETIILLKNLDISYETKYKIILD